ncbi:MAG: HEAT repeat domain-containing protein [Acidobacteria bacterium]|nr:HEAT repeat domain-containing protein [Acidobacteriota bacterium]
MRNVSAQTAALIERLNTPASLWEKITSKRDDAELIEQIADEGEPAAVVDVAPFVLSENPYVARAAAAAVDRLLSAVTPDDWAGLDSIFRERSPYTGRYRMEWHRLAPKDLDRLERFADQRNTLLGLASFHKSGYVREEAVHRLARSDGGAELPFLLIRLNDWVGKVRETARQAIIPRLSPRYGASFVENLPLVARLGLAARDDHGPFVEAVESLLKSDKCLNALLSGLESDDRSVRRICFRLAAEAENSDTRALLERALAEPDTVIRLWAARRVSEGIAGGAAEGLLELMKGDHFMPVRREALRTFVNRVPEKARAELRRALFDQHASVREEARFHLRKAGEADFASIYRTALADAAVGDLYSAVGGIGETGTASDDLLVLPYALRGSTKVRRAAIKSLAKLNGDGHLALFVDALKDETPTVSREARKALAGRATAVGGGRLWDVFSVSSQPHVRRNALHLLARLGKWDGIHYLIRATGDTDERIAEASRLGVVRWLSRFNRSFSAPTPEQVSRLESALREHGHLLDERVREWLWFSVKGFRGGASS